MIIPLEPNLKGYADRRFIRFARQLATREIEQNNEDISTLVELEVSQIGSLVELQGQESEYEACVRVLGDLAKLRWRLVDDGYGIELHSPAPQGNQFKNTEALQAYKASVRDELRARVDQQFASPSVKKFILRIEQPSKGTKRRSILDLIADGRELQERLRPAQALARDDPERHVLLRSAVKPYLQLVEANVNDEFTNVPLRDIWRYFRYTWSIPQTPIPGRHLDYLIRDASQCSHAVIGIIGLSNSVVQLTPRDRAIGWTSTELIAEAKSLLGTSSDEKVSSRERKRQRIWSVFDCLRSCLNIESTPDFDQCHDLLCHVFDWLQDEVSMGIGEIESHGLVNENEILHPTPEVIARLKALSKQFASSRQDALAGGFSQVDEPTAVDIPVDSELIELDSRQLSNESGQISRRMLIGKKRALELSRLLEARRVLSDRRIELIDPLRIATALRDEEIRLAVNTAMSSIKGRRIGTNMLEITTCGAVSPYNRVLGGKLVALLALSPQVSADYRNRYGSEPTIIRSQLKNANVVPDNTLVWLNTTSLFAHGSSQYERLKLPAGTISTEQPELRFEYVGDTSGYGTIQFSDETVQALERALSARRGYRDVNGVFGEGASPRLRKLRIGLDALGFRSDLIMLHHQVRRIYAIPLFKEAASYLCGLSVNLPHYLNEPGKYIDASERIAEYWRTRWLSSRLAHDESWEALGNTPKWELSTTITSMDSAKSGDKRNDDNIGIGDNDTPNRGSGPGGPGSDAERLKFWHRVAAAGSNTVTEGLSEAEYRLLHLNTPLEDYLITRASEGTSIVLTGNAGDGKTHLAFRLRERLGDIAKRFEFMFDATAMMSAAENVTPIIQRWSEAQRSGRGVVLAINQYPLYMVRQELEKALPDVSQELDQQWEERLIVDQASTGNENHTILLVDLSLRNVLDREFAQRVFEKILHDPVVERYAKSGLDVDFAFNHDRLSNPTIQSRLFSLFDRLVSSGYRASVRELWILTARLLFGVKDDRTQPGSLETWYSERLFNKDNRFPVVAVLRNSADPAGVSHLHVDSYLENSRNWDTSDWIVDGEIPDALPASALTAARQNNETNGRRFPSLKRRYYFEHENGGERVFELDRSAESRFHRMLKEEENDSEHLGELIEGINRCYFPKRFEGIREKLCLWVGHRLDEQPTRSFVAREFVGFDRIKIQRPYPPTSLGDALQYSPDHLVLRVSGNGGSNQKNDAILRIDAILYRTLTTVVEGMPRHLISAGEMNRIDTFIDQLQNMDPSKLTEFLVFNSEHVLTSVIKMSTDSLRYLDVRRV